MYNIFRLKREILFPIFSFIVLCFLLSRIDKGDIYSIIYVHVPTAWLSFLLCFILGCLGIFYLLTNNPVLIIWMKVTNEVALMMTGLTLITGAIWGKMTWGVYWVWDSRLTSVLFLFIVLVGTMVLLLRGRSRVAGYMMIIGIINIPIIKYSVEWWTSIHQPASITTMNNHIHSSILLPLLCWFFLLLLYVFVYYSIRLRTLTIKASFRDS